jgi:transcriptional regulator GlxA family with amidase domain
MYLRRLRIAKAEELLSTGLRVKDAALRCGFSDEYTFIKCYKQLRSRTPGTYRRDRRGSPIL